MTIRLSDTGKRYNREWIFRHANLQFQSPGSYAITGPNGSGKSTLLQTIGGLLQPNEGSISFRSGEKDISSEAVYRHTSFCAPYLDLPEEMTLEEFLRFHSQFKPFCEGLTPRAIIEITGLRKASAKQIRNFSSGMKQRVKLAQAILSATDILLLDEPCTNLDSAGIALYHSLIDQYAKHRLIVVSSNDEVEYRFCEQVISMSALK
jgi:ABC-type multidrug transport system ATPase subunit